MTVARNQIDEVLGILCSRFPNAFFMHEGKRKPLAVGIGRVVEAILGDEVKGPVLHRAPVLCQQCRYLRGLKVDAVRVDIDGNEAGGSPRIRPPTRRRYWPPARPSRRSVTS